MKNWVKKQKIKVREMGKKTLNTTELEGYQNEMNEVKKQQMTYFNQSFTDLNQLLANKTVEQEMDRLVKEEGNYIDFNIIRFYVQEAQYKFDKGAF